MASPLASAEIHRTRASLRRDRGLSRKRSTRELALSLSPFLFPRLTLSPASRIPREFDGEKKRSRPHVASPGQLVRLDCDLPGGR